MLTVRIHPADQEAYIASVPGYPEMLGIADGLDERMFELGQKWQMFMMTMESDDE